MKNKKTQLKRVWYELKLRVYPDPALDSGARLATQIRLEGLLAAFVLNLATVFTAMFATRLGANPDQIGLLSSLPQWAGLLVLLPGTLFAGRFTFTRRPVEVTILSTGLLYGLAALAPYMGAMRVWYLIMMIAIANAPMSLYNVTWQNYFSEIVEPQQRNNLYTMRTSMTFAAGIVVVQITGLLLGQTQDERTRIILYQVFYTLAFVFSIIQWLVIRQSPSIRSEDSGCGLKDLKSAARDLIKNKPFLAFTAISVILHSGWYMGIPLFFLIQVEYMQANETWLSYITVSSSLLQWLTVRYWSRFIDRHGIRLAVVIGAVGMSLNPVFTVLASIFPLGWRMPAKLFLDIFNALTFSAFQLSILQCLFEVVPLRYRQINLSFYTALLLFSNALMQLLGVRIYVLLGSTHRSMSITMFLSSTLRLLGAFLFFLRWRKLRYEPDAGKRFG